MPGIPDSDQIYPELFATRIMTVRLLAIVSRLVAHTTKEKTPRECLLDIAELADGDADKFMLHGLDAEREHMYRERIRANLQAIVVSATTGLIEV